MIPKYFSKRTAIHLQDPADLEGTFLTQILTIGLNIAPTIVLRINDIRNLTRKHTPTSRAIFYFYRLLQHYHLVNHLLNCHCSQLHRMNNYLVVEKASRYSSH